LGIGIGAKLLLLGFGVASFIGALPNAGAITGGADELGRLDGLPNNEEGKPENEVDGAGKVLVLV
jgi:hypothetical protein